ncbi:MAG TPA: lysozyme inhibitor LprI family protein [Polyangia bacterium]|nr:lysozyme inhibitor LprI family protein [Polyangia bacterium]
MNVRRTMATSLLGSLLAMAPLARAASFDCAKAKLPVEKMLCSDAALSDLDGRLAAAYRRALGLASNPEPLRAEQRSWLATERKKCADVACLRQAYQQRLTAIEAAAPPGKEPSYSFTKAPFINPKIINDLSTALSDQGDQVLAIDLTDSETSNRYACDVKVAKTGNRYPYVYAQDPVDAGDLRPAEFGYRYVGRTTSGLDVLFTAESGGGSGVFEGLMLVRISEEIGAPSVEPASGSVQTLTFRKKRLVIKKVGELGLGDRWDGILGVSGNEISIGKDTGALSRVEATPARVVKIASPP